MGNIDAVTLKCLYDQMRLYIYRISVTRRHEKVKTDSNLSLKTDPNLKI